MSASPLSSPADRGRPLDALELYASAIDTSDYVARIVPMVRRLVHRTGALLDVGAGGGQLGAALRERDIPWTAIEPSSVMRVRLAALHSPPHVVPTKWQDADVPVASHDTVLAATMPALFDEPELFLTRCKAWTRQTVAWVVPAHQGPRGLCFAGCLPSLWHGEDETPGIDIVLRGLARESWPHDMAFVDWTFSGVVKDVGALAAYLADRLGWAAADDRRPHLARHLSAQAVPDAAGSRLNIARKSAILVWGKQ